MAATDEPEDLHGDPALLDRHQGSRPELGPSSHAEQRRLRQCRGLGGRARADLVGRLGLHRPEHGDRAAGRVHRARPRGRVDLPGAQPARRAARLLQRVQPPRHQVPRRLRGHGPGQEGVQVSVPRLVVRPGRQPGRVAERPRGRRLRPVRLPAVRLRGRRVRRLPVRQPDQGSGAAPAGRAARGRGDHHGVRALPDGRTAPRPSDRVRGQGELEDRRRELQRVPALPADPPGTGVGHPAVPVRRGLGRRLRGRRQPDGRRGHQLQRQRQVARCRSCRASIRTITTCTRAATSSRT